MLEALDRALKSQVDSASTRDLCFCPRDVVEVWKQEGSMLPYLASCGKCGSWSDVSTGTALMLVYKGAIDRTRGLK